MLELDFNLNDLYSKTDEELVMLAEKDKSAAAALLSRYSKLIFIKSKIYANSETDSEDLRQEGCMSLLKAISAYDPSKGSASSTVCVPFPQGRARSAPARRALTTKIRQMCCLWMRRLRVFTCIKSFLQNCSTA